MDTHQRRVQRREFRDYQPLFMLVIGLDIIDERTRRAFACINGEVWQRYNAATKGARERRITVLFLSNEQNSFEELLFVGCDFVKRREHRCELLWAPDAMVAPAGDEALRHVCIALSGRSVLRLADLSWPGLGTTRTAVDASCGWTSAADGQRGEPPRRAPSPSHAAPHRAP